MKPYASYKPSGVSWLGEVPAHWEVKKVKHLSSMRSGEGITSEDIEVFGTYPVYGGNGLRGYSESFTHVGEYILVGRQGALCGNVHQVSGQFWASEHAVVATFYAGDNVSWAKYLFEFMNLGQYSVAAAQPGLAVDSIQQLYTLAPPFDEQQVIADYLDTETVRIDELIREKENLIGLLREYRQSVIAEAVLKGLNPDAPLKPSGVPWLGEVPAHWEILRLRFVIDVMESGKSVNAADVPATDLQLGVLKTSCVYTRSFRAQENKTVVPEEEHLVSCPLRLNALIVSRMNTPDLVGAAGLVKEAPSNVFLPDRLWQVVIDQSAASPSFIHWFTNARNYSDQVKSVCSGSSESMQNLAQDKFRNIVLPIPPLDEQQAIADYLDTETARIDDLITHSREEINLLKELRAATIADAVTGKIQVS